MGIVREDRINAFHWILELKNLYGFNDITAMHSIKLYDRFMLMNKGLVVAPMHALIAIVCLCLSVKMHENCILDFEQAAELCEKQCNIKFLNEMFMEAEFKIFKQFDFNLNQPTAVEMMFQIMFLDQ